MSHKHGNLKQLFHRLPSVLPGIKGNEGSDSGKASSLPRKICAGCSAFQKKLPDDIRLCFAFAASIM